MTRGEILENDLAGLYDNGERDFFEDCRELLNLDDDVQTRIIFQKASEYSFGPKRSDWLEAFEDWVSVLEE